MTTYQVEITINSEVESEWLHWMKTKHIPDIVATGLVSSFNIMKPENKPGTYVFQYHFASENLFREYENGHSPRLRKESDQHYGEKFTSATTLFEWI
jgi:hypothetical protein